MKQFLYNFFADRHRQRAIARLDALERRWTTPEDRFRIPFVFRGSGFFRKITPRHNKQEIEQLYQVVCELAPQQVLEIGTARGGSLYLWAQAARDDATIVSADLPGGDFGGGYPAVKVPFYKRFARPKQTMHLLRADSHDASTRRHVGELFGEQPVDFAFIDGDHTYEGVRADFYDYGPLVRPGGLIAFHDILPRQDEPHIQVDRFWAEIRDTYETVELIGSEGTGRRIGIGYLTVPEEGIRPKT
jgi:predicted O-methyltransferase YrrM